MRSSFARVFCTSPYVSPFPHCTNKNTSNFLISYSHIPGGVRDPEPDINSYSLSKEHSRQEVSHVKDMPIDNVCWCAVSLIRLENDLWEIGQSCRPGDRCSHVGDILHGVGGLVLESQERPIESPNFVIKLEQEAATILTLVVMSFVMLRFQNLTIIIECFRSRVQDDPKGIL